MVRSLQLASHHRADTREGLGGDNGAWRPLCPEEGLHVQRARSGPAVHRRGTHRDPPPPAGRSGRGPGAVRRRKGLHHRRRWRRHAVFPMLAKGGADNDPGLDPALFSRMSARRSPGCMSLWPVPACSASSPGRSGPACSQRCGRRWRTPVLAAALTELSARIRPRWDSIVQALSAAPQRVHGDVHGGNLLTDGQKVTGIIDWDHLPLAPRGYDLGYFMAFAVHWRLDDGNQPSQPVDEAAPFIRSAPS